MPSPTSAHSSLSRYEHRLADVENKIDALPKPDIFEAHIVGFADAINEVHREQSSTKQDLASLSKAMAELQKEQSAWQKIAFSHGQSIDLLTETVKSQVASRDVKAIQYFALLQSAGLLLNDILEQAPEGIHDGPLRLDGDFVQRNEACKEFLKLVRRKLDHGGDRRSRFEGVMVQASTFAERQVEDTPQEQRPTGIDPLALRKYVIAHLQCARAIDWLQHERGQITTQLLGCRPNLLDSYKD